MAAPGLINRYAGAIIESARRRGFDDETIQRNVGVPCPARGRPLEFSPEHYARISRYVKLMMEDELCGMTPSRIRLGSFTMMCRVAAMSGTLGAALTNAFEFYRLISDDIRFEYRDGDGDQGHIRIWLSRPDLDDRHMLIEWWFLLWNNFSSWLIGEEIPVLSADLPHEQSGDIEEYHEVLSPNCRFRQREACLTFDRRFLSRRIIRSVDELEKWTSVSRIDLVTWNGVERNFRSLIRSKIRTHLQQHERFLSMEQVADELGISTQTVRRRLESGGTSYRQIKEEVRREAVIQWLRHPDVPIGEISLRAGFAEPNGLFRAVKSWVGMSPSEYRSRILSRGISPDVDAFDGDGLARAS